MSESTASKSADVSGRRQYVALQFTWTVETISMVREFLHEFLHGLFRDEDAISRMAMATHELLENAAKYSTDGSSTVTIDVGANGRSLGIHMENRATAAHRHALETLFAEMRASSDPAAHYVAAMQRSAKRTDGGSGLGLARIRAEAEMDLDIELDGDIVRLHAATELPQSAPKIDPITLEAFGATAIGEPDRLVLRLTGNADLRACTAIDQVLAQLHTEALRLRVHRVDVDFTDLSFMNSSCFKGFLGWLTQILELPERFRYRVHLKSNPETLWQRRSLHALRSYALAVVTVERPR